MTVETQAMPHGGDAATEDDAAGALRGGEAHRGDPSAAPHPLGRKDPALSRSDSRDDEAARKRP